MLILLKYLYIINIKRRWSDHDQQQTHSHKMNNFIDKWIPHKDWLTVRQRRHVVPSGSHDRTIINKWKPTAITDGNSKEI